jgi:electron-transferring-flavoprotein dehydrogenase
MGSKLPARDAVESDVVIVGAGPAGLAAAIRLKQLSANLNVVVVEKGSEVGAHILSGAVIDPIGLDRLLPDWRTDETCPIKQPVTEDRFYWLGGKMALRIPTSLMPPLMSNKGNFIVSLGNVCRWLGKKAEALGIKIHSGFAVTEVLYGRGGEVIGVATGDMGIDKYGNPQESFTRGIELRGKYTLIAEGARGSLSKEIIARFALDRDRDPQKFGIGFEELWQVQAVKHHPGLIQHSFGWPLGNGTGGGSFLYHFEQNLVAVGSVVHLDDHNPFGELQRFKTHPLVRGTFDGATRLVCGARATTAGGWQSVPKLVFPGGALIGCAAGFMNVARIKGSHNAIWSAVLVAEHAATALAAARAHDELISYEMGWRSSVIGRDLRKVRNLKPLWSKLGTVVGTALGGLDIWTNILGFSLFGTLHHGKPDPLPAQAHRSA